MSLRRLMNVEVKVIGEKEGLVEYRASDETLDSYREVVLASGWKFDQFKKNAPFVNSHDYSSIENLLGTVVGAEVRDNALMNTVKWAKDVPENRLAQLGWKMTLAGHLKAVSVGFVPTLVFTNSSKEYQGHVDRLGLKDNPPTCIYGGQQQIELSAVILGANPNALATFARSYKDGVLDDDDMTFIAGRMAKQFPTEQSNNAAASNSSSADAAARQRMQTMFLLELRKQIEQVR